LIDCVYSSVNFNRQADFNKVTHNKANAPNLPN